MKPSRKTQPYRRGSPLRRKGRALMAMTAGRTLYGKNPMTPRRTFQKAMRRRRRVRRRAA